MSFRPLLVALVTSAIAVPVIAAGPLAITTKMLVEKRVAGADGTTRTQLVTPANVVPGDRVTVVLGYRNTGTAPIGNVVLANPVPRGMAYRLGATRGVQPELSVDGQNFGSLAGLRVRTPAGATRAATPDDVTQVRWRLPSPIAAGAGGELAFQAVLK